MKTNNIYQYLNLPSNLQLIKHPSFKDHQLYFKRDDSIHPLISGNKWRKLMFAIDEFYITDKSELITFGGAFSNHLLATAVACNLLKIKVKGIVRTEEIDPANPTLQACRNHNMELIPLSRSVYKKKSEPEIMKMLEMRYPESYMVPEGGSSRFAIQGVGTMIDELMDQIKKVDVLVSSLGTAGTASGIIKSLNKNVQYIVAPAIKQYSLDALKQDYKVLTSEQLPDNNILVLYSENNKAYAKKDLSLFLFIEEFFKHTNVLLDPIYTGKAMRVLLENLHAIPSQSNIVFYHSGGIQAWNGYFYRFESLKDSIPYIYKYMQQFNKENEIVY